MSRADIAEIVIGVVATLISFGALIYTMISSHQNKVANQESEKKIDGFRNELNDLTREQNTIFIRYFEKFHKDFQEMIFSKNEVKANNEKDILSKEEFTIQPNQSQLDSQERYYELLRKQDKKVLTEQKRKNSAAEHVKR